MRNSFFTGWRAGSFLLAMCGACSKYATRHVARADSDFSQHQYRDAIDEYNKAIRVDGNNAWIIRQLGLAHFALAEFPEAFRYLSRAEELNQRDVGVRITLAKIYLAGRRPNDALTEANAVLKMDTASVDAFTILGAAHALSGRPSEAVATYRRLSDAAPTRPDGPLLVGQQLLAEGKLDEAARQFDLALQRDHDHLGALAHLVQVEIAQGKADLATRQLDARIAAHSRGHAPDATNDRAYLARLTDFAGLARAARNETDVAERAFLQAAELDPDLGIAHVHLAQLYLRTNKKAQAEIQLQQAAKIDSTAIAAEMTLGMLYQEDQQTLKAEQAYGRILSRAPGFLPAAVKLAVLLVDSGHDTARALELARTTYEASPDDPYSADAFGWVLFKTRNYDRALPLLTVAAAKLPNEVAVQYHAGAALQWSGDIDGARRALTKAASSKEAFPERDAARKSLTILTQRSATPRPR